MYTFELNEKCEWWRSKYEFNKEFVMRTIGRLEDMMAVRGYLYISEIYNAFGVEWNPLNPNTAILQYEVDYVATLFSVFEKEKNRIIIHVEI